MFLLAVIGAAVIKLEFNTCLCDFIFFFNFFYLTILGIDNVIYED
jgi:hypothetical protein